ncbi:non-ribosomal peptide synthetase [Vibrio penaeicida]|uniref:Non-ribosomal peptide synthetase n=1 Tax=Vibrio penaeicida TaxID=104609 RepID=A0AAV5NUV4_9VIBR|nr:non-ribosomal peptide synthetase [Vibrio penaeicida]RTZ19109.1 amino acid adenylation domain-containing protein [Vibrio penaeicida]GLQ74481.1 non-ribosomal peptide synthetase [Vibrio penaeicida]
MDTLKTLSNQAQSPQEPLPQAQSLQELREEAQKRQIRLWVEKGQLRFKAPKGAMDANLLEAMKAHKSALISALSSGRQAPQIASNPQERYEPFPLTDLQQAYWVGEHGGYVQSAIACYVHHVEFKDLSEERVQSALHQLQSAHEVLRTRFKEDGTQQIMPVGELPIHLQCHSLRSMSQEDAEAKCVELADNFPEQVLPSLQDGPPMAAALLHLPEGDRLIFAVRLIVMDGPSLARLFHDLLSALSGQPLLTKPQLSYRDYVLALRALDTTEAESYWSKALESLPEAPQLPMRGEMPKQSKFVRLGGSLGLEGWTQIKKKAQAHGTTPNAVMFALYASVLRLWSQDERFVINMLTNFRPFDHAEMGLVVGNHSNTILMTSDGQGHFIEQAKAVQAMFAERLPHASLSGVSLLRRLQQTRDPNQPAVPFVFTSGISQQAAEGMPNKLKEMFRPISSELRTPQVWLDHQVVEDQDGLLYYWDYVDGVFEKGLPEALFERFEWALSELLNNERAWLSVNPAALKESDLKPLVELPEISAESNLGQAFLNQVQRSSNAVALIDSQGREMTYLELAEKALSVAQGLVLSGVKQGDLVGVSLPKGSQQIISVIGIVLAGGAWLPMDIRLPDARRKAIIEQSGLQLIIGEQTGDLSVDDLLEYPELEKPNISSKEALAYVIYTSGSTGQPKGVATSHEAVLNTLYEINRRFSIHSEDKVLALSALNFDLSVYDIWGTLITGASIVIPPDAEVPDPMIILEQCKRNGVTVWNSVPALLEMAFLQGKEFSQQALTSLKVIMLSGDWIPMPLAKQVLNYLPKTHFYSLGGATEASIWSNYFSVTEIRDDWRSIPYGYGLAGQQLHVLDKDGTPCLPWVVGQIYIEGLGLADGYYNDVLRTQSSFITHKSGRRLYSTGDLGRWRDDGSVEFLGRLDFQLKLRGHRIEAGDVESHLLAQDPIKSAVVMVVQSNNDQPVLVALCTGDGFDAEEIRHTLRGELPAYMVPSHVFRIDAMPLNVNGKRDQTALRKLAEQALTSATNCSETCTESATLDDEDLAPLATLWAEILGSKPCNTEANFFLEGGTSMLGVQLIREIKLKFDISLPLATLFENPTLSAVWRAIEIARSEHSTKVNP